MASSIQDYSEHLDSREITVQIAAGSLMGLIALYGVMLAALFSRTEPHPPLHLAPFLGACIAVGLFALPLLRRKLAVGFIVAILFALVSFIAYGPHKLFAEGAAQILPAVVVGFAFSCALLVSSVLGIKNRSRTSAPT
jgi:hypothetical protein